MLGPRTVSKQSPARRRLEAVHRQKAHGEAQRTHGEASAQRSSGPRRAATTSGFKQGCPHSAVPGPQGSSGRLGPFLGLDPAHTLSRAGRPMLVQTTQGGQARGRGRGDDAANGPATPRAWLDAVVSTPPATTGSAVVHSAPRTAPRVGDAALTPLARALSLHGTHRCQGIVMTAGKGPPMTKACVPQSTSMSTPRE